MKHKHVEATPLSVETARRLSDPCGAVSGNGDTLQDLASVTEDGGSDWLSVWGDIPSALSGSGAEKLSLAWSTKPDFLLPVTDDEAERAYGELAAALTFWRHVSASQRDRIFMRDCGREVREVRLMF